MFPYVIVFFVHNFKKVHIYIKNKNKNQYTRIVATTIEIINSKSGCISIVSATLHPYNAEVGTYKNEMRFQNLLFRNNRC